MPSWETASGVLLGTAEPRATAEPRVAPALLAPTERRRAPDTVAIALEVAVRACEAAGADPRCMPSVFASTHGDLPINDYMCSTLATTPMLCSPTKFHNSVHNAASGYWTIGTGCAQPSTALTAWQNTFAAGLLEALVQAVADATPVLYVAYDVASRGPLAAVTPSDGLLAAALVLVPADQTAYARIARLRCAIEDYTAIDEHGDIPRAWADVVPANAMRQCLPLLAALVGGSDRVLKWRLGARSILSVGVEPAERKALP